MHTSEIIIDLSEDEANVFAKPYAKQLYVCFLFFSLFLEVEIYFKGLGC